MKGVGFAAAGLTIAATDARCVRKKTVKEAVDIAVEGFWPRRQRALQWLPLRAWACAFIVEVLSEGKNAVRRTTEAPDFIDGRSLRATGRTSQLATRIHPDIHHKAKMMAARDRITMAELIKIGIQLYEERNGEVR